MKERLLASLLLALAGCGGSPDVTYLRLVSAPPSNPNGTNCQSAGTVTTTVSLEGAISDVAIYAGPNNTYFLNISDLAGTGPTANAGVFLSGTLSGSSYTFSGKVIDDDKSDTQEVLSTENLTVTMTVASNAVSNGTMTTELVTQCQSDCTNFTGGSDCTTTTAFQGTVLPNVEPQTGVGP